MNKFNIFDNSLAPYYVIHVYAFGRDTLSFQTGQLNEYTERKEMSSDVVCMALGRVPTGEQRCRFLAVGLSDNTVRIVSLDPSVSLHRFKVVS